MVSLIMLGHCCVTILLAKMLIWESFSQSMCTFSFCINTWMILKNCLHNSVTITKCLARDKNRKVVSYSNSKLCFVNIVCYDNITSWHNLQCINKSSNFFNSSFKVWVGNVNNLILAEINRNKGRILHVIFTTLASSVW